MASKQPSTQIKVCLVAISLGRGGAERSTALLSQMLTEKGFNVTIVILYDVVDYPYKGNLLNLGKHKKDGDTFNKRLVRLNKLKQFLKQESFDFILDNRTRSNGPKELFYLKYVYANQHVIYVVRSFNLLQYFPKEKWIAKKMINNSKLVIGVSKAISEKINAEYKTNKAKTIYNPVEPLSETGNKNLSNEKYILYLGRIEEQVKNFTLLLNAYKKSKLPEASIHLKIVGDGPDVDWLKQKIETMSLSETVSVNSFTPIVFQYLKNALYLTLTSYYEGFPRVLIEALSVGTPVISVDCKSGPEEIVSHKKNGLLVENHNELELAEAMNSLAFDTELYKTCKANAQDSISHLKMDAIGEQWANLLNNKQTRS